MPAAADFLKFRAQFPTVRTKLYLNSGSYGLLADSVRAGMMAYLDDRTERGADWGGWVGIEEQVRDRVATLLGARPDEVAVTASASAGINAVASSIDFGARPKVVVSNYEFPTSAQIWHAQEKRGARVIHVAETADRKSRSRISMRQSTMKPRSWRSRMSAIATEQSCPRPKSGKSPAWRMIAAHW